MHIVSNILTSIQSNILTSIHVLQYVLLHTLFSFPPTQELLRTYDKDILQDLLKVRASIRDIREGQRQLLKEESKYLSVSSLSSETSEKSQSTSSLKYKNNFELSTGNASESKEEEGSLSPSPPLPAILDDLNAVRLSVGPVDMEPPEHLQQQSDDQVLADFFGSEQLGKLDKLKKGFSVDAEGETEENKLVGASGDGATGGGSASMSTSGANPSHPASSNGGSQTSVDTTGLSGGNQGSSKTEPVSDMVSEMQKLRLRLQEETRQELAKIDRQYSPKLFCRQVPRISHGRQSSVDIGAMRRSHLNAAEGNSQPQHSRDGSLDSSAPRPLGESLLEASFEGSLVQSSGSHTRQYSLPSESVPSHYASPPAEIQYGKLAPRSPSPRLTSPGGTHYDSYSLERTRSPSRNSRSPTPPYQRGHVRQGSVGSSGSGGLSPPYMLPSTVTTSYQQPPLASQARVSPDHITPKPYSTPPLSRATTSQQYHPPQNPRHPAMASGARPPPGPGFARVTSGGTSAGTSLVGGHGLSQQQHLQKNVNGGSSIGYHGNVQQQQHFPLQRNSSGGSLVGYRYAQQQQPPPQRKISAGQYSNLVTGGASGSRSAVYGSLDSKQTSQSNKPISTVRNGMASVPRMHGSASKAPHYSTAVIKGKKHKQSHQARSVDGMAPPSGGLQYDHLSVSGHSASQHPAYDRLGPSISDPSIDQPEQKSIPRGVHRNQSLQSTGSTSHGHLPRPPIKNGPIPGSTPVSTTTGRYNGAPVYPAAIEPYMTTALVKQQMQPFAYTPYTDKPMSRGSASILQHQKPDKRRGSGNYDSSEQTWC